MKTILLIEEDEMMRENTTEILELSNYKVFPAENGYQGLELVKARKPDLIICDMVILPANSIRLLKEIKKIGEAHQIPFIMIAANAGKMDLNKNPPVSDDIYLSKPFEGDELLRVVEDSLRDSKKS